MQMQNLQLLNTTLTSRNRTLFESSQENPVLLVFLRHFGCVFCREAMKDIARKRKDWESKNINIVLVHMSDDETANQYFKKYNLSGIEYISDPACLLYSSFGLTKGSVSQLFGLKNWIRGFEVTVVKGTPIGLRQIGDGFQMPGVFLVSEGKIMDSYIHASASDRPDYESIISCCAA